MKKRFAHALAVILALTVSRTKAQTDTCSFGYHKHTIASKYLKQSREFWVSLPLHYSDTGEYKVMYVLDAEWRFNLTRNIEFDYSANKKIDKHIIVGIPHIDWEYQRGRDLSFSESRIEYDGDTVDSTWYNKKNAGGGAAFYAYLTEELVPSVDSLYATNGRNTLVGHSMGGYFAGYILSKTHPFESLHLYDPSIWYSDGEVIDVIAQGMPKKEVVEVLITYQPVPSFHKSKIDALIAQLKKEQSVIINYELFQTETHNGLFLPSFLKGMELLMK